jgi:hypothetical protein
VLKGNDKLPEPWMAFVPCFKYYSQIWIAFGEVNSHLQGGDKLYTFQLHVPLKCIRLVDAVRQWHDVLRDLGAATSFAFHSAALHWNFTSVQRAALHFDGNSCSCGCICDAPPPPPKGWTLTLVEVYKAHSEGPRDPGTHSPSQHGFAIAFRK